MLQKKFPRQPCARLSRIFAAEQFQRIFPENIRLNVERTADVLRTEICHRARMRDAADSKI